MNLCCVSNPLKISADLNLETVNRIFSETNHIRAASNSLSLASAFFEICEMSKFLLIGLSTLKD